MIVQCPNCDSRYRVNDANVPASGGKITCPSCHDKFIVYPETSGGPDTEAYRSFEDKTSVAKAPALRDLVDQMAPQDDDMSAETEVMSPLKIPDSLHFDQAAADDDGTVEMSTPDLANLRAKHEAKLQAGAKDEEEEEDPFASTEILDSSTLDHMGFHAPSGSQASLHQSETREHAPLRTHLEASSTTERPNLGTAQPSKPAPTRERPALPIPKHTPATTAPPPQPSQLARPMPKPAELPKSPAPTQTHPPKGAAPDATHEGPWKLKTNFGLTYEFSDSASLQSWLSNRKELDGYELAGNAYYYPVSAWPQFKSKAAAYNPNHTFGIAASPKHTPPPGAQPGSPGHPTSERPASGPFDQALATPPHTTSAGASAPANWGSASTAQPPQKIIKPTDYRPSSANSKLNLILWPIAGTLFAIGVLLAVQVLGVYDLRSAIMGETPPAQPVDAQRPAEDSAATNDPDPAALAANTPKASHEVTKAVDRLIEEAERAIENNRLQSASVKLNNAKLLDAERVSIYALFVKVYTEMGRTEDAEAAQKTLDELRGASHPSASDDEDKNEDADKDNREDEDSEAL